MPEFTKGEWKVEVFDKFTTVESELQTICTNVSNCDAYLISAAPEMYQAIKDDIANRTARYEGKSCGHQFFCICPDEAILKALKKVEGK